MSRFSDTSNKTYKEITGTQGSGERSFMFSSFAGTDIQCFFFGNIAEQLLERVRNDTSLSTEERKRIEEQTINDLKVEPFAELQTLTVSIASSFGPVRRLGEKEAVEYKGGARTIAGSMIFAVLNRDVFHKFMRNKLVATSSENYTSPDYVDQIPAFNILVQGINEFGSVASGMLIDVKLTNFGTTFSVDDMYLESTYNYVARQWVPFVDDVKQTLKDFIRSANYPQKTSSLVENTLLVDSYKGLRESLSRLEFEFFHGLPERVKESITQSGTNAIHKIRELMSSVFRAK